VVASPSYLARRAALRTPRDVSKHDVIFTATRPGPLAWRFAGPARERVVPVVPRMIVNEVEATLLAVRAGRGIARALSYQVVDDLASGTMVRLLAAYELPPLPVQLVVPSARHLSAKARSFLDHAARALAALPVLAPATSAG
jgi:DNA-binding transcriptional LysR family regulator